MSETLEAAGRKLSQTRFFHRRLVYERDGRLFESEPGAFSAYLGAFLAAGESVRYLLQTVDRKKYDEWLAQLPQDTDRDLLTFMNRQRGKEIHGEGADTTAELELIPDIVLARANLAGGGHPAYGVHFFGPPGSQMQLKRSVLYLKGDQTDSVAKCAQYLRLLEELVQEFTSGS